MIVCTANLDYVTPVKGYKQARKEINRLRKIGYKRVYLYARIDNEPVIKKLLRKP